MPQKLILKSFQSPGDVVVMTAAVRDLHRSHPGRFLTDVRTTASALWEHNPFVTRLDKRDLGVRVITMHYPLIGDANRRPFHFLHGYPQYLERRLGIRIDVTDFRGDIHLSASERNAPPQFDGVRLPRSYWILIAGGKYDFTTKWWSPESYQAVVDHFAGRLAFVQCGEGGHWHPPLRDVVNLVGRTTTRDFVRLMHFATGVVCPITFAMHLAAAVPVRSGEPGARPCVVIAGGREPPSWEAYPHHQFMHTIGALSCCAEGGCWKSRCQLVGDGNSKDRANLCEQPMDIASNLRIPLCMHLITPADVCRRIEYYLTHLENRQ